MNTFPIIDPDTADPWLQVPGDWRRPHVGDDFSLLWDPARSYGQLWPRPDPQEVAAYYETDEYYTHGTGPRAQTANRSFPQRVQDKLSWLADKGTDPTAAWWSETLGDRTLRILEIGCGNGSNLSLLSSLGHEVKGIEPDPQAVAVARKSGHWIREGTAEALPEDILDDRFDVIVFMHVMEHCIDPFLAMRNAVRLLADGGRVIAEVPNNECIGSRRFGALWYWLDVPRHLNFFTGKSLGAIFRSAGLDIESVSYRGYCRQFSSDWKRAQTRIADTFGLRTDKRTRDRSYWTYLAQSALARRQRKYDSVRIVGKLSA